MINLIVAHSINKVIGVDGKIPWKIKGEQKQFKELTTNNTIIMGRHTYEEIGKPLSNRLNVVISRSLKEINDSVVILDSLQHAIEYLNDNNNDIYIIGGGEIYKEALSTLDIDNLYITVVNRVIDNGTVFFPEFDETKYNVKIIEVADEYTRYHYYKK